MIKPLNCRPAMPLLDLDSYAELTPAERTRRIGALLEKGIRLYLRHQRMAGTAEQVPGDPPAAHPVWRGDVTDDAERKILQYFARVREATPRDLRFALSLSRATVSRKLKRLRAAGLLVVSGKTNAARYHLQS